METTLKEGLEHQIKDSAVFMQQMGVYESEEEAEKDIRASYERIKEEDKRLPRVMPETPPIRHSPYTPIKEEKR